MFLTISCSVFSQNIRIASLRCINAISHFPVHEVKSFSPPLPNSNCVSLFFLINLFVPEGTAVKNTAVQSYHPLCDIFRCCRFGPECCELWLSHWMTGRGWLDERQLRPEHSGTLLKRHKDLVPVLCSIQPILFASRFLLGSPGGRWFWSTESPSGL